MSLALNYCLGRIALWLLGYTRIDEKLSTVQYVRRYTSFDPASDCTQLRMFRYKSTEEDSPQAGDVILANHSSYIDLIYLKMRFAARFTRVAAFPPHKIVEGSVRECVVGLDSQLSEAEASKRIPLKKLVNLASRPLVVFPEGTRSNGRALLRLAADLSDVRENHRVHLVSLRHDNFGPAAASPTFPVFSYTGLFVHLWSMLTQWNSILAVKHIPPNALYRSDFPCPSTQPEQHRKYVEALQELFVMATPHIRAVGMNMVDKLAFLRAHAARR